MSEWKKASEVLPASNETVVFLDKGAELDVGRYGSRCFNGINGTRHANGVDYWMSLPAVTSSPNTKTEALREAIRFIESTQEFRNALSGTYDGHFTNKSTGEPLLPRLRAALESED